MAFYNAFQTEIASFKNVLKRRITEISNRIGYVNSKDVAGGGADRGVDSLTISASGTGYSDGNLSGTGGSGTGFTGTYTILADGCPTDVHNNASDCNAATSGTGHSGGGANWVTTGSVDTASITNSG